MNHVCILKLIIPGKSYSTGFIIIRILYGLLQTEWKRVAKFGMSVHH